MSLDTSNNDSKTPGHGVEIVAFETNLASSESEADRRLVQDDIVETGLPFGNDDAVAEDGRRNNILGGAMTGLVLFAMTAGTVWVVKDNRNHMVSNSAVVVSPGPASASAKSAKALSAKAAKAPKTPKAPGGGGGGGSSCVAADPLSCFESVGWGLCKDAGLPSRFFSMIKYTDSQFPVSNTLCASKCVECVDGAVSNGSFRGFTVGYNRVSANVDCGCHLDFGATHNPASAACTGELVDGINSMTWNGMGEITGTDIDGGLPPPYDDPEDWKCYKFLE
eukprot:scaffold369_cov77-Skeletonema_dohrnii-CCMP3373.AAC.3